MGFLDLFNEEKTDKETRTTEVREIDRTTDTEFATDDAHLDLRAEVLDIDKHRVETGDVTLHKNIIEEEQSVNVPVSHDQIVIERRSIDHEPTNETISEEEDTIRIPVTAEKIDVGKHTVVTGEIMAHVRSVQETEQVHEVLRKEVADIETHGTADMIEED